jgi:hypothetical protein
MNLLNENSNYLGKKGYTIYKINLNEKEKKKIYNELNVKPFTQGQTQGFSILYPVYRESSTKLLIVIVSCSNLQ